MTDKKTILHIGLMLPLLLALLLSACSADSGIGSAEMGEAVEFSLSFAKAVTRAGDGDNRTVDNLWPAGAQVTISNGTTQNNFTTGSSPGTSSGVAVSLAPVSEDFIWPTNDPHWSFSAWYPAGNSPAMSQTVIADQNSLEDAYYYAYDILYCPTMAVTFRQKPVTLNFLHQMARVVVIVNSTYTETKETVTEVKFGYGHIALSRNIDALATTNANGQTTWKDGTQNSTITMRTNTAMTNATSHVYAFECMLPPQASTGDVTNLVQITTDKPRTYNYTSSFSFQSGYQYTYNLLISEQGVITLATVQVTDWTTGSPVNNTATIPDSSYPANPIN